MVRETALLLPESTYSEEPLSTRGYGGAIVKDKEGNVVASVIIDFNVNNGKVLNTRVKGF